MFPKVYRTIHTPAVAAIVADRIGRHGEIGPTTDKRYITWQIIGDDPQLQLSGDPCTNFTAVQIDCYHDQDAGAEALAVAVRAALNAARIANRVVIDGRDTDTRLYRVGLQADFIGL
jgi:hypothetical protein